MTGLIRETCGRVLLQRMQRSEAQHRLAIRRVQLPVPDQQFTKGLDVICMQIALQWEDLEIEGDIGHGNSGRVCRARLRHAVGKLPENQLLAVKRFKNWVFEEPGQYERIFRELEVGRRFRDEHLVETISVVADDNGKPALVMAYYDGESLQQLLDRHRANGIPVEYEKAAEIIGSVASALSILHTAGIVHRDVKPSNVMLSGNRTILMDLGVVTSQNFAQDTTTEAFLGTIRYAAPEYLFGETYDTRADTFALGAIAYELATGVQYDADQQHWARLVVKKGTPWRNISPTYLQKRSLGERLGLARAQFLVTIIQKSLSDFKSRNVDLTSLHRAVSEKWFDREFHFSQGRFETGSPLFPPLGEFSEKGTTSLGDILEQLKARLSKEDVPRLRGFVQSRYWDFEDYESQPGDYEEFSHFRNYGVLQRAKIQDERFTRIHEAIKHAVRHELL